MVKILVDFLGDILHESVMALRDCILIINPRCELPSDLFNGIFKLGKTLDEAFVGGNWYYRVSDEFERGFIIGTVVLNYSCIVYTSRPEVIKKYFSKCNVSIQIWPTPSEAITLTGYEETFPNYNFASISPIKNFEGEVNFPRSFPPPPENPSYVQPISIQPSPPKILKNDSNESPGHKKIPEKPNPLQPSSNNLLNKDFPVKKFPQQPFNPTNIYEAKKDSEKPSKQAEEIKKKIDENSQLYKESLERILSQTLESEKFFKVKLLDDLYSIVFQTVRSIGESINPGIIEDNIRSEVIKLSLKKIFSIGLFSVPKGKNYEIIIDNEEWKTEITMN